MTNKWRIGLHIFAALCVAYFGSLLRSEWYGEEAEKNVPVVRRTDVDAFSVAESIAEWRRQGHQSYDTAASVRAYEQGMRLYPVGHLNNDDEFVDLVQFLASNCAAQAAKRLLAEKNMKKLEEIGREATARGLIGHYLQLPDHIFHGLPFPSRPWHDSATTGRVAKLLMRNFEKIRKEVMATYETALQDAGRQAPDLLVDKGTQWNEIVFYADGKKITPGTQLPFTTKLVHEELPEATTHPWGNVKISVLHPGHIVPHFGMTNTRIRIHLGISVPEPDRVAITVGGETRTWSEGNVIAFDDSFLHEVWHNGTQPRIVLICDIWPHGMTDKDKHDSVRFMPKPIKEAFAGVF